MLKCPYHRGVHISGSSFVHLSMYPDPIGCVLNKEVSLLEECNYRGVSLYMYIMQTCGNATEQCDRQNSACMLHEI